MEQGREFFKTLHTDPEARRLLDEKSQPTTMDEAYELYAEVAEKLGFSLTAQQIAEAAAALAQEQKGATAQAEEAMRELDPAELAAVAGAKDCELDFMPGGQECKQTMVYSCSSTFDYGEWCWFDDACESIISVYAGYP